MFLAADYRLLLPYTSYDQLEDVRVLSSWLTSTSFAALLPSDVSLDTSAIMLAGTSAGLYIAMQFALQSSLTTKAVLSLYGSVDYLCDDYICPSPEGIPSFGGRIPFSAVKHFFDAGNPQRSSGSPSRTNMIDCEDGRHLLLSYMRQEGSRVDHIAGRPGLSASLAKLPTDERGSGLEEKEYVLFPLLQARKLPPTFFIHGDADSAVTLAVCRHTVEVLEHAGVGVQLIVVKDAEHAFLHVRDMKVSVDCTEAYAQALAFLDRCLV
jgi:acetyl esterase/lipase